MQSFIIIILLILIYIIVQYNIFVSLKKKLERSKSGIDIYLSQRFDLIPNLVECVKQYSSYEQSTLDSITRNRSFESCVKKVNARPTMQQCMACTP